MKLLLDKDEVMPIDLKPGDVMVTTITCYINYDGTASYYDCNNYQHPRFQVSDEGIPQGGKVYGDMTVEQLFPARFYKPVGSETK